ncbi:MAG: hypothetical protein J2P16_15865 [Mycobacterium sp.]|nr:hypothetical protein [Mycobacterium sp.]
MSIVRRNHGRGHSYLDGENKLPGVTTILGDTLPKKALIDWAGRTTANYAIDFWDELCELSPSKRLDRLNRARFEEKDTAARRGTEVHRLGEALVKGEEVDVPEELAGHVQSYVRFLDEWEPTPVAVEMVVAHRGIGYAGTADLVADMRGTRWLLDLKTARSGIFPETALQLCAYARAEIYLCAKGDEHPMADLGIERVGAIHVRADGFDLYPLEAGDDVWTYWRHLCWLYRHRDELDTWVGRALAPLRAVS